MLRITNGIMLIRVISNKKRRDKSSDHYQTQVDMKYNLTQIIEILTSIIIQSRIPKV